MRELPLTGSGISPERTDEFSFELLVLIIKLLSDCDLIQPRAEGNLEKVSISIIVK